MKREIARRGRTSRLVVLMIVAAATAVAGYLAWSGRSLVAGGTPQLVVDRTEIDFGDVSYGRMVTAEFTLKNGGDGTLMVREAPVVKALKGC